MPEENKGPSLGQKVGVFVWFADLIAFSTVSTIHKPSTRGDRYASGIRCLGAFAPFIVIGNMGEQEVAAWSFIFVLAVLLIQRIGDLWRPRNTHSEYWGRAWIVSPRLEPLMVILCGLLTLLVSPGVGTYLILSGICMAVVYDYGRMALKAKTRAIRNARIEAENVRDAHERGI